MAVDRVKFQDILTSQVPEYVKDDFPLLAEFLKQYYVSQEYQGGSFDLAQNIDQYETYLRSEKYVQAKPPPVAVRRPDVSLPKQLPRVQSAPPPKASKTR